MDRFKFREIINKAIAEEDFLTGLRISTERMVNQSSSLTRDEKVETLRLIRGLAAHILNCDLDTETRSENGKIDSCDYCGRSSDDSILTQGHSGTICGVCAKLISRGLDD